MYRAVYWLFWEDSAVHLSTVCLLLLAAAWDWCAYILVPPRADEAGRRALTPDSPLLRADGPPVSCPCT